MMRAWDTSAAIHRTQGTALYVAGGPAVSSISHCAPCTAVAMEAIEEDGRT